MNLRPERIPVALTIAGSDSGGGAGIQADLKTFAALGVHGTSAITCLTAQNPKRVLTIEPVSAKMVEQQLEAIFEEFQPCAVKTGMLFSSEIIQVVVDFFRSKRVPLIIDPVMIASSGARLLKPSAIRVLQNDLLPLAKLITPNLDEAEVLSGRKISSLDQLCFAAKEIFQRFGCATLVKGGHLPGVEAIDCFYDGKAELKLRARFVKGVSMHGSGCMYSAAIVAHLARGLPLPNAIKLAKKFVTQRIRESSQHN